MCKQQHHIYIVHKQLLKAVKEALKQNQCPLVVGNFSAPVGNEQTQALQ